MPYRHLTQTDPDERLEHLQQALLKAEQDRDNMQRLTRKLHLHQMELEMQNRELHRTQQALETSHNRYRQLYDYAPMGYMTLDPKGNLLELNLSAAALLGLERRRLLNLPLAARLDREEVLGLFWHLQRVFGNEGRDIIELQLKPGRDGRKVIVRLESMVSYPSIDEPPVCHTVMQEITGQRHTKQALRESEGRLQQLMACLEQVFWMTDGRGERMLYVSPAYEVLTGHLRQWLYEDADHWLANVHPDDALRVRRIHERLPREEGYDLEYRILRPDGSLRRVHAQAFAIRDNTGTVCRLAGILEDITRRRTEELQRQRHQAHLAHLAHLALAGEMASGMAHELNQPLTAVSVYLSLQEALLESEPVDIGRLRELKSQAEAQTQRAGIILNRIRCLTRHRSLHRGRVNLVGLIEDTLTFLDYRLSQAGVVPKTGFEAKLPLVWADSLQVQQVLLNLLCNALEALQGKRMRARKLRIQARRIAQDRVEVSIRDNGSGLCEADPGRLFEPFYTTKAKGTGLGLTISQTIVEDHGGRLWATPNTGPGMTFHFTLPPAPPVR